MTTRTVAPEPAEHRSRERQDEDEQGERPRGCLLRGAGQRDQDHGTAPPRRPARDEPQGTRVTAHENAHGDEPEQREHHRDQRVPRSRGPRFRASATPPLPPLPPRRSSTTASAVSRHTARRGTGAGRRAAPGRAGPARSARAAAARRAGRPAGPPRTRASPASGTPSHSSLASRGEPGAVPDHLARDEGDGVGRSERGGDARPQGGAAVADVVEPADPHAEPFPVGGAHGETATGADARFGGEHLVQGGLGGASATRPAPGHEFRVLSSPFEGDDGYVASARGPATSTTGSSVKRADGARGTDQMWCDTRPYARSSADRTFAVQLPSACGTVAPRHLDDGGWVGGRPALRPALDGLLCESGERGEHHGREKDRVPGGTQPADSARSPAPRAGTRRTPTSRPPLCVRRIAAHQGVRKDLAMVWAAFNCRAAQRRWAAHSGGVCGPSMAVRVRLSAPR